MESSTSPRYFWGDSPEETEYYASRGVRNTQSYFPTPHGRLFTQSFLPLDSSRPVKGLVCLTHGYASDSGWMFQNIAIAFASWGYAAHCADMLGHGRSDGIPAYVGDMESVAAASLSYFLSLTASSLPAFLFGESLGGAAALLMYLRSPPGIWTGLLFSAPLFVIPDGMKPSRLRIFLYGLLFGAADTWAVMPYKNMVGKSVKDPDRLRVIAANPRRYAGPPRVGTMREISRLCDYLQENFNKVSTPFFTAHGTDDGMASPEGSRMIYERATTAADDKTLKIYPGMYHSLIQGEPEENSRRVLADMREWIDDRVARYGGGGRPASGEGAGGDS